MPLNAIVSIVSPVAGREEEFNDWYESTHIPEVLALDGYRSASRYAPRNALAGVPQGPTGHMTVFEVETEDVNQAIETLASALPNLTMSDAVDLSTAHVRGYQRVGSW
jgi:hypothetical protein